MHTPDGIRRPRFAEVDRAREVDGLQEEVLNGVCAFSRVSGVKVVSLLLAP